MTDVLRKNLWQRLWPRGADEDAFAILDGARDPAIYSLIQRSTLAHRCLYIGDIAPVLARAAPWLVNLAMDSPDAHEIIQRGWGKSWGIFLRSSAGMAALHRHFRRFLRVKDERGETLLFRYYDPRVMRAYLPTCTPEELAYVFGPVQRYVLEGETSDEILEYGLVDGALAQTGMRHERRLPWLGEYLRKNRDA